MRQLLLGGLAINLLLAVINLSLGVGWTYICFNLICALMCWVGYDTAV